jgi:hypothetical protein
MSARMMNNSAVTTAATTNTQAMTYAGRCDNGLRSVSGAPQSGHRISPS